MFFFCVFSLCVDESKYGKCADSKFCTRNREISTDWELIDNSTSIFDNNFFAVIHDKTYENYIQLNITSIDKEIFHFRIDDIDKNLDFYQQFLPKKMKEKQRIVRYDASLEESIIDQNILSKRNNIIIIEYSSNIIKICADNENEANSKTYVEIVKNPFSITVYNYNNEKIISINKDSGAVFESNNIENDVFPSQHQSVAMSFEFNMTSLRFSGLPHHTLPLSLPTTKGTGNNEPIRLFNTDINSYVIDSRMSMYGAIPLLIAHNTEKSIGVFWNNPSETWIDLDNDAQKARFISESNIIDFYIFSGSHKEVTQKFARLTGLPQLHQQFLFGYHQCRWTYYTSAEIREVSSKLDDELIPHDVMWMDLDHTDDHKYFTFHPNNYKDVKKLQYEICSQRRRLVAQVDPHLKAVDSYYVYKEANDKNLLVHSRSGDIYYGDCWPGRSAWVDFINPTAREWWAEQFHYNKYKDSTGVLFTWNDMNEPSVFNVFDGTFPRDCIHYGNRENRELHNIYGHLMVLSTYNGHILRTKNHNERPFVLTRSYYAGSQKYSLMWTGDNTASWDQLKNSIAQTLSLGICAYPYSGSDVGGFFNSPNDELLSRWYQLGAFVYPFFRCHCHHLSKHREPYTLGGKWKIMARNAIVERYQLFPYWYTCGFISHKTGDPIARPLYYEFKDKECLDEDTEVIIGDSLLVAPVVDEKAKKRNVYLPRNTKWYKLRTLEEVDSGIYIEKNIDDVPVFIKGGKIIPEKRTLRKSTIAMFNDSYTLIIAPDENNYAEGILYVDDGHSFNYQNGEYIIRKFIFDGNTIQNKIDEKNGVYQQFDCNISTIIIANIKNQPAIIKYNDEKLEFEYRNNVITLFRLHFSLNEEWKIVLVNHTINDEI